MPDLASSAGVAVEPGRGGGFVARLAGGVAALVLLAVAAIGIVSGARTTRLYANAEEQLDIVARSFLATRVRSLGREVSRRATEAEVGGDWSALQRALPSLQLGDPDVLLVAVTDGDGLVLAAGDAARDGLPLAEPELRALLSRHDELVDANVGGAMGLGGITRVGTRLVWVVVAAKPLVEGQAALRRQARSAVRFGWILVVLGGVLAFIAAISVVVVIGGSIARRLRVVAWRIGELGRGDLSTHVQLDGPAELRRIGFELDRATQRLAKAGHAAADRAALRAETASRQALVAAAIAAPLAHAGVEIAAAIGPDADACAFGSFVRGESLFALFVEIASDSLADHLLAAELRAAGLAIWSSDPSGPASLLTRLEPHVSAGRHARVAAVSITGTSVTIAVAGTRFPYARGAGATRAIVMRSDRLGEASPRRYEATLPIGDGVILVGEAPASLGGTLDGHAARKLELVIARAGGTAEEIAQTIVAPADAARPGIAVVVRRASAAEILAGERGAGEHRSPDLPAT